jgi:hypothetical protein
MPRVSLSTDYLLECDRYYQIPPLITNVYKGDDVSILSPNDIDKILSRKLYEQLKAESTSEKGL